ncbi:DUF7379 domain-containing protein [Algoriphagus persicinus]|uniref:DUF7379 domain-containing protein n=1 Tax=Algoriphagus persicinus TaxID=3108754 RepID=UPI002B3B8257|nr:CHAT domain-containing protein [Algoriphagus sp. E1-3-M2]MEB2785906.1 CHAT domain-containing protein [Algoriphagus sp. E1-3-M2]
MATLKIKLKGQDHLPFVSGEDQGFDMYQLDKAYTVMSPTRGDVPEQNIEIDEQTIIEFEFEDQTVWLGDKETLHILFPKKVKRSADGDEFYLPDELDSDEQDRGIFKKVGIKLVKFFVKKKIIQPKMRDMATNLENKQLAFQGVAYTGVKYGVLALCSPNIELSPLVIDTDFKTDSPYLLLLHGTASSTESSFGDLKDSKEWLDLVDKYGERHLLAFQHRSLTASPLENILELVQNLPAGIVLDLLSQSRGGLLAELLARFCTNSMGFDATERALLSTNDRTRDIEVIKKIETIVAEKKLKIRSMVRVAGPANGTTLASNRLNIFLNVTFNLIGLAVGHVGNPIFVAFKEFIMEAVACKDDVDVLPGLEAMNPKSTFIKALNHQASEVKIEIPLFVVGGSSELSVSFKSLVVLLGKFFFRGKNDLVVDTESMKWGSLRDSGKVAIFIEKSGKINHFKYFSTPATLEAIIQGLSAEVGVIPDLFDLRITSEGRGVLGIEHGEYASDEVSGNRPIAILIPGIMGSNIGKKDDLLWINYLRFLKGELTELALEPGKESPLSAPSLIKTSYGDLGKRLSSTYDIVTFPFDWRLPLKDSAALFDTTIQKLLRKNQPIKIVAHSMGGVLVRDFMVFHESTWQQLNNSAGFRGLFLGSPLGGSYRIPYVLFGKDSLINLLGKIDIKHSTKDLLKVFCNFPGILNLLPIDHEGKHDFSDRQLWEKMRTASGDESWPIPSQEVLDEFGEYQRVVLEKSNTIDFSNFTYIAGQSGKKSFTISNLEVVDGELVFYATNAGDESVTWASGIPSTMIVRNQLYYANVTHGSLPKEKKLFNAIEELLIFGSTKRLQNSLPKTRGEEQYFEPTETEIFDISEENLITTILGLEESEEVWQDEKPINVYVSHGDLKYAKYPVLAGHFEHDAILNAEYAIDKQLGWELSRLYRLGLYPGKIGSNQIVLNEDSRNSSFPGGIIVGLGVQGELSSFLLINSVEKGVARYLTIKRDNEQASSSGDSFHLNGISVIAIANTFGGLSSESSVRAIMSGVQRANRNVREIYKGEIRGIEEVEIIELYNDRALSILKTIQRLGSDDNKEFNVLFKENGLMYTLGRRWRIPYDNSSDWWTRVNVAHQMKFASENDFSEVIRMAIATNGASEKVEFIPSSDQTLDVLLNEMTVQNQYSPEIATAMYELLVPYNFKEEIKRLNNIWWILDISSASYPWEMVQESVDAEPLCINIGMVRQLATGESRQKIAKVSEETALVVGDPMLSDYMPQLSGAKKEAELVAHLLRDNAFQTQSLINSISSTIILSLFSKNHKIIHLAGHGVFNYGVMKSTGMVIGKNTFLTPGQIAGMSSSAELVFVNCCYLGQMDKASELMSQQSNKFAANIGTQLINNGARAVIVAGWAVDDAAALEFSKQFYTNMFRGLGFGEAVKRARKKIYDVFGKTTNTWGAFQCYGDPFYTLNEYGKDASDEDDLCLEEIQIELENLLESMSANEYNYEHACKKIDRIHSISEKRGRSNDKIIELIATTYSGLQHYAKSCECFEQLFASEKASYSLKSFEHYGNVQAKLYVQEFLARRIEKKEALKKMDQVLENLKGVNNLFGQSFERLSLMGSTYKRKLQMLADSPVNDMTDTLAKAVDAYQLASEKCANTNPYPLTNWMNLLQIQSWIDGKTYLNKSQKDGRSALDKLFISQEKGLNTADDFWGLSHVASLSLTQFLLGNTKITYKQVGDSYLKLWKKAGNKANKVAEIEHLEILSTLLSKIDKEKVKTINADLTKLMNTLKEKI